MYVLRVVNEMVYKIKSHVYKHFETYQLKYSYYLNISSYLMCDLQFMRTIFEIDILNILLYTYVYKCVI